MKVLSLIVGLMGLIVVEILRVYLIMPFPGSQETDSIQIAYFLDQYILYFRLAVIALCAYPLYTAAPGPSERSRSRRNSCQEFVSKPL